MTFNQQIISLFPLRHRHDGCMRPLIRSSIRLERKRRWLESQGGTGMTQMESTTQTGRTIRQAMADTISKLEWDGDVLTIYSARHRNGIDLDVRKLADGHYCARCRDTVRGLLRFAASPLDAAVDALTDYIAWINS